MARQQQSKAISLLLGALYIATASRPAASSAEDRSYVSCSECLQLSSLVLQDLRDAYPHKSSGDDDYSEDLMGGAGNRRRMIHVWSETEIYEVLDSCCSRHHIELANPRRMLTRQCEQLVRETRDEVENHAFSQGPEGIQELMCTHVTGACQLHEIEGGGEL